MQLERKRSQAHTEAGSAEVGQFEFDPVTGAWSWSDALYRLYGYEPRSLAPSLERFLQHKDPRDMARIDAVFDRCLSEGGPFSCYHRIIDAQGRQKTVVVVGFGDRNDDNTQTVRMHGFLLDVTAIGRDETTAALEAALKTRGGIEQAKGALMLVYAVDADGAFNLLRGHSQIYNKKLARLVDALLAAFRDRAEAESVSRREVDRMLWDAAH